MFGLMDYNNELDRRVLKLERRLDWVACTTTSTFSIIFGCLAAYGIFGAKDWGWIATGTMIGVMWLSQICFNWSLGLTTRNL
jgi:hypothetical protein